MQLGEAAAEAPQPPGPQYKEPPPHPGPSPGPLPHSHPHPHPSLPPPYHPYPPQQRGSGRGNARGQWRVNNGTCFVCGAIDHWAASCPQAQPQQWQPPHQTYKTRGQRRGQRRGRPQGRRQQMASYPTLPPGAPGGRVPKESRGMGQLRRRDRTNDHLQNLGDLGTHIIFTQHQSSQIMPHGCGWGYTTYVQQNHEYCGVLWDNKYSDLYCAPQSRDGGQQLTHAFLYAPQCPINLMGRDLLTKLGAC
ncbi:hypothetical protein NHX12_002814 [Muraenolepis orangiensis]|uniref:CCHC-type domain-containing protein n=1 Tax=Muraenolepis orangiensis TaxID=630683 RepID=A0A9Q0DXC9_9TELE|nr:hypothetical protein NHX12_002814 [Muraenolepis orangiensis]